MELENNTFKIFLTTLKVDDQEFEYFDVSKLNEEKYCIFTFFVLTEMNIFISTF
jgi:hypothetical protein